MAVGVNRELASDAIPYHESLAPSPRSNQFAQSEPSGPLFRRAWAARGAMKPILTRMPPVPSTTSGDGIPGMEGVPPSVLLGFFDRVPLCVRPMRRGFSGSPLAVVDDPSSQRPWVVKRFAQRTPVTRAVSIHAVMRFARDAGIGTVPSLKTAADSLHRRALTVVAAHDGLWEAAEYRLGRPVDIPSPHHGAAAGMMLSEVHRALEPCTTVDERPVVAAGRGNRVVAPVLRERLARLRSLAARPWSMRADQGRRSADLDEEASAVATLILAIVTEVEKAGMRSRDRLASIEPRPSRVQWVLRDMRAEHLLFDGDAVSGIVDWHAAGVDNPIADLARLLGDWSLADEAVDPSHERDWWQACLDAYDGLDGSDRELVRLAHEMGLFGALDNWFTWVIEERRHFPDWRAVARRVSAIGRRLLQLS